MGKAFKLEVNEDGSAKLIFDLENEKVNKFSGSVIIELGQLLDELRERKDIKIMSIESAKENIFIAGADISELEKIKTSAEAEEKARTGQEIFNKLEGLPFPTVAVINGACLGGGLEFALACTYRIVTDNEKTVLGCPEVNLGIIPGWGGTQRLPRLIGLSLSLPMILSGKPISSSSACRTGLANAICAKEFVSEKTAEFSAECLAPSGKKRISEKRSKLSFMTIILEKNPLGRYLLFNMARKDLLAKTRGKYPAPLAALDLIKNTFSGSIKDGFKKEAKCFSKLAGTSVSKNLIRLFFTSEELKKDQGTDEEVTPQEINSAGVVGAGVMGGGIAWLFSFSGLTVRLKDINWDAIAKGFSSAMGIYNQLKKIKKIRADRVNLHMHRISGALDYSGFKNLDLVIEAVVEKLDVKKKLFAEIEGAVRPGAVICSNTSSLPINEMAGELKNPERFCGMHFFNPVNRMPLVEIIPGEKTSPQTIAALFALSKKLKKTPILVHDCPGFLVNRILLPYMNEAVNLLEEGADLVRIDNLLKDFGLPMGPFELADEVGIDICCHVMRILAKAYSPRMQTSELLNLLYDQDKLLGKKSKKGFYLHSAKNKTPNPLIAERVESWRKTNSIQPKTFSDAEIVDRCVLMMLNEASRCLLEKVISKPSYLDMAMILGAGYPAFRGGLMRYADEIGIQKAVDSLKIFSEKYGERFNPSQMLLDMAREKKRFYKEENYGG